MAEKSKRFEKIKGNILPWLLCSVMMSAVVYIYTDSGLNLYAVVSAAMSAALFWLFDFLRTKKLGGLMYFVLLLGAGFTSSLILGGGSIDYFVMWFFSGAQAQETRVSFMAATMLFLGFFFTSVVYYFTRVVYRSAAAVLITLIPFALAVKVAASLPYYYIAAAAALNLFIFLYDSRSTMLKSAKPAGSSAFTVYTDFAAAAVILALIIPKPDTTPFYDKFEAATARFSFGADNDQSVMNGDYYNFSGNADNYLKGESRLLYVIGTADPVYMKAQVFDRYDSENRCWTASLDDMSGTKYWQEQRPLLSYEKLAAAVGKAAESDSSLLELYPQAERLSEITDRESFSVVYARDYSAVYVLAPLRATAANLSNVGASYSARTDSGEIFTNLRFLPPNGDYTVRYYSESVLERLIEGGFCDISFDDYFDFLYAASEQLESDSDEYKVIFEFEKELARAGRYREDTATEVSPEIQALADEITAGLEYDYQKAQAIEDYFQSGSYIYSLAYEAPKELDTPEYFIFESKMGTCSDFATAYTLLARASGLAVRYAEGFVPQPSSEQKGIYLVNTDNAHAYPEVYIPGAGWVIYEPTAPDLTAGQSAQGQNNAETDYLAMLLTAVAVVMGIGAFILLVMITPKITEGIFRIRVKRAENGAAVKLLYNRYAKILGARLETDVRPLTPEQLAELSERESGESAEPMIKPFTAACYGCGGAENISGADKNAAYEWYKAQLKILKKNKKRKRKEAKK